MKHAALFCVFIVALFFLALDLVFILSIGGLL